MEITRVNSTSSTDARMVVVRSRTIGQIDGGRNGGLQLRQQGADAIDGLDDVGAGLAEDDDQDGRLAVGEAGGANVFHRIGDVGDIGQAHRAAVLVSHDQRSVIAWPCSS